MRPVSSLAPGTRFDAEGVKLETVTSYECNLMGERVTKWRHVFRMADGKRLFYTGTKLVASERFSYHLRATIKRHEFEYGGTRIMRPVLKPIEPRQPLL